MPSTNPSAPAQVSPHVCRCTHTGIWILLVFIFICAAIGVSAYYAGWLEIRIKSLTFSNQHSEAQPSNTLSGTSHTAPMATSSLNASLLNLRINLPADIPYWSGGKINYSKSTPNPATNQVDWFLIERITDPADQVVNFYKTQLIANGWTINSISELDWEIDFEVSKNSRTVRVDIRTSPTEVSLWWSL